MNKSTTCFHLHAAQVPAGPAPAPAAGGSFGSSHCLGQSPSLSGCVQVAARTWARDSHGLFDFEEPEESLHVRDFAALEPGTCIRQGTAIRMLPESADVPRHAERLVRLERRGGGAFVVRRGSKSGGLKSGPWLVVKDLANASYPLSEGDVLRVGRSMFRVRQLVTDEHPSGQARLNLDEDGGTCHVDEAAAQEGELAQAVCRICLMEGPGDDGDPLIRPCACKGSIEHVHLGCLRHWIDGRIKWLSKGSYFYTPMSCELCKAPYPASLKYSEQQEQVPLVEAPQTAAPFIVLESMMRDTQQHVHRGLHVVSLAERKSVVLGRGHKSDVRISDVSISRQHATICFQEGRFMLADQNSKHGTLIAMQEPFELEPGRRYSIQIGRTVLSLLQQPHASALLANEPAMAGSEMWYSQNQERAPEPSEDESEIFELSMNGGGRRCGEGSASP